jgi:uncharacterized repeat protein (TIGR01451 family)
MNKLLFFVAFMLTSLFAWAQPNLIVQSASLAATATSGSNLSTTVVVKNTGNAAAVSSTMYVYLSTNTTFETGTDILLTSSAFNALAANASQSKTFNLPIPAGISGTRYILYRADAPEYNQTVIESNENDNQLNKTVVFSVGTAKPDLIVHNSLTAPATVSSGSEWILSYKIRNQGTAISAPSIARIYLSNNNTFSADDIFYVETEIPILAAGITGTTNTISGLMPDLPTGTKYMIVIADATGLVTESNETNNTRTKSIFVQGLAPDLTFESPEPWISPYVAPNQIQTLFDMKNVGQVDAVNAYSKYYVSANASWDSGDALLFTSPSYLYLPGQVQDYIYYSNPTPAVWKKGGFYLIGKADPDNLIAESDETNNQKSIFAATDFYVNPYDISMGGGNNYQFSPGDSLDLKAYVQHAGTWQITGLTFRCRYYISADDILNTATDLYVGEKVSTAAINNTVVSSPTITIPASYTAGTYRLIMVADPLNEYPELNEDNNYHAFPFEVITTAVPKVKVVTATLPASVPYGVSFNTTVTIKNTGTQSATGGTVNVLLTNSYPNTGGLVMGTASLPTLAPGQSTTLPFSISIANPSGLPATVYYIGYQATGVVNEINSYDNLLWKSIQAINQDPDLEVTTMTLTPGAAPGTVVATGSIKNIGTLTSPATTGLWRVYKGFESYAPIMPMNLPLLPIPTLSSGQSHSFSTTITIEQGYISGEYKMELFVNWNTVFIESGGVGDNNYKSDTLFLTAAPVNYTYYDQGAGSNGNEIRRLSSGNFQVIGTKDAGGYRMINTNGSAVQLSSFDSSDSLVVFGNNGGFLGLSYADNNTITVKSYNTTGTILWTKTFDSPNGAFYAGMHATATTNGYAIATSVLGDTISGVIGGPNIFAQRKVWVLQLNELGIQSWNSFVSTPGSEKYAAQITQLGNGNLRLINHWSNTYTYSRGEETTVLGPNGAVVESINNIVSGSPDYSNTSTTKLKPGFGATDALFTYNRVLYGGWSTTYSSGIQKLGTPYWESSVGSQTGYNGFQSVTAIQYAAAPITVNEAIAVGSLVFDNVYGVTLFKYSADGTKVSKFKGPGAMRDITKVNNNLFALTGRHFDQATIVFIDSLCQSVAPPGGGGTGGGSAYDLALSMSVSNPTPAIYTHVTFTATLTNQGTQPMTGVVVGVPMPTGLPYSSHTAAAGTTFDAWNGVWTVPTIAAGQTINLSIVLFTLNTQQKKVYGQVTAASNPDADSAPNNGTSPNPVEDDEAVATINAGGGFVALPADFLQVGNLYPNPSRGTSYIELIAPADMTVSVALVSEMGKLVVQTEWQLQSGRQTMAIDLPSEAVGMYYLIIEQADGRRFTQAIEIMR